MNKLSIYPELPKKTAVISLLASVALLQACGSHEAAAQPHEHNIRLPYEITETDDGPVLCWYDQGFGEDARWHTVDEGDTISKFIEQHSLTGGETMTRGVGLDAPTYDQIVQAIEARNDVTAESLQIGDTIQLPVACEGALGPDY